MRNLVWTAAVAIVVMASGAVVGQKTSRRVPADIVTVAEGQLIRPGLHATGVVDRILSFDANGDDRIAPGELPERMEILVSRGDTNQDGFLTSDEVIALVTTQPTVRRPRAAIASAPASIADVIADLKLPPSTHTRAMAMINSPLSTHHPESVVLGPDMRTLLGDEDHANLVAAVARFRHTPRIIRGSVGGVVRNPAPQRR
jgi:hypothetical protein